MYSKINASLKLSAIGDALGWITEFEKDKRSIQTKYGCEKITRFYNWEKKVGGKFYGYIDKINAGSYSDDTQLVLAVARSLNNDGSVDNNYFAKEELSNWLFYARGGGRTVKKAAEGVSKKNILWNNNFFHFKVKDTITDYRECGANGAAMRILPIALMNAKDVNKLCNEIFMNSIITHGHPRAIIGAMLHGYIISKILFSDNSKCGSLDLLVDIGKNFREVLSFGKIDNTLISEWLRKWNNESKESFEIVYENILNEVHKLLKIIYLALIQKELPTNMLSKIGCFDDLTKGSGILSTISALYLFCYYKDTPIESLYFCVNELGIDTDTIASLLGAYIGCTFGMSVIPERWNNIQDGAYIEKIAKHISSRKTSELRIENIAQKSNYQIINNMKSACFKINEIILFQPLGIGKITSIERQDTFTKGYYNLIFSVDFEIGQSAVFSKVFKKVN